MYDRGIPEKSIRQTGSQDLATSLILNLISDSSQNSTAVTHCVVYTEDQKGGSSSSQTDFSCDIRHVCSNGVAQVKVTSIFHFFVITFFECSAQRTVNGAVQKKKQKQHCNDNYDFYSIDWKRKERV